MYFILILLLFYSVSLHTDLSVMGYTETSPWWTMFTYNLVHLSFLHLLVNSFVIYSYWRLFRKHLCRAPLFLLLAFTSVFAAILSADTTPTVGASSIGYSMIGIFLALYNISKIEKGKLLLLVMASFFIPAIFSPHINTLNHAVSFITSLCFASLFRKGLIK